MNHLLHHTWPGNVRDLEKVVEHVANFVKGNIINIDDLPPNLSERDTPPCMDSKTLPIKQRLHKSRQDHDKNASQIHQIIMNLCTNAARAMKGKGSCWGRHNAIFILRCARQGMGVI